MSLSSRTLLVVSFPFILLVHGSVVAHRTLGTHGWVSILVGASLATICLAIWGSWLWRRFTGRDRFREIARYVAIPLVVAFCVYALGWISSVHAKSPEIRDLYSDLHPSLRLAIGTAILVDSNVVITEIARTPTDYARMGLIRVDDSLHFTQPDGWIHAVDLRTRGRGEFHNGLSKLYFHIMGFNALRHGGTGDHLHISLPRSRRNPGR